MAYNFNNASSANQTFGSTFANNRPAEPSGNGNDLSPSFTQEQQVYNNEMMHKEGVTNQTAMCKGAKLDPRDNNNMNNTDN